MAHWVIIRNEKPWVARCPEHKLTAQGGSWEDLQDTVREIMRAYCEDAKMASTELTWEKQLVREHA